VASVEMGNGLGTERRSTKPLPSSLPLNLNAQQSKRTKKADESRRSLLIPRIIFIPHLHFKKTKKLRQQEESNCRPTVYGTKTKLHPQRSTGVPAQAGRMDTGKKPFVLRPRRG
jgi:hypothetical protein